MRNFFRKNKERVAGSSSRTRQSISNSYTRFTDWTHHVLTKRRAIFLYGLAIGVFLFGVVPLVIVASVSHIRNTTHEEGSHKCEVIMAALFPPEPEPKPEPFYEPIEIYEPYEPEEPEEPPFLGPFALLTGIPIYEEYEHRRPMAVVINNIFAALPQYGISYADVVYEVLAEGNITRLVAIFHSQMPDMVGPVRSTRNYFAGMAMNHDAFFMHYGGSIEGYARIRELRLDAMDGGPAFWRDRTFPAWSGLTGQRAWEHSAFTGWQRVTAQVEARGFRDTIGEDAAFGFQFGIIPEEIERIGYATHIAVPFSVEYTRRFDFDEEYGSYMVSHGRGPHLDALTDGGSVVVHNILVQTVNMRILHAHNGARNVDTVGSGTGYLFTQGERFAVTWEKPSHAAPMRWYFACGTPLVLSPGRTWINVLQATATVHWE
ncbi:MAG: DUF3048 domain-containing protein [Defluviitaleaceae bacterium]|nr:DUF3048 domain-containing protein [Defluviitaleaceae bacterium]